MSQKIWSVWSLVGECVFQVLLSCQLAHITCLGTHHITFKTYSKQPRSNKLLLLRKSLSTWFWVHAVSFSKTSLKNVLLSHSIPRCLRAVHPTFSSGRFKIYKICIFLNWVFQGSTYFRSIYGLRLSRVVKNTWPLGPRVHNKVVFLVVSNQYLKGKKIASSF